METNISSPAGGIRSHQDEYLSTHFHQSISLDAAPPLQLGLAAQSSPPKKPLKPEPQLENLPVKILEKIVTFTYQLTLEELPDSHPLICDCPTDDHFRNRILRRDETRAHQRNLCSKAVLLNQKPPAHLGEQERSDWLHHHPGQWGPVFQIMFASKRFYEIAKPIRYREVHIDSLNYKWRRNNVQRPGESEYNMSLLNLCEQLTNKKVLKEFTRDIHLHVYYLQSTRSINALVKALNTLPRLEHVCVTIKDTGFFKETDYWLGRGATGKKQDLIHFFKLKVQSLTFIWAWGGSDDTHYEPDESDAELDKELDDKKVFNEKYVHAPISTKAEHHMQKLRTCWMKGTYERSPWCKSLSKNEAVWCPLIQIDLLPS